MTKPTITGFIIGLLFISLIAGTFTVFIGGITDRYGHVSNISYNNATLANYQKLETLNANISAIKDSTQQKIDPNVFDVIGGYLKGGYDALKLSLGSFDIFYSMAQDATLDSSFGEDPVFKSFSINLRTTLVSIVIVLIFIGILMAVLVKKDVL